MPLPPLPLPKNLEEIYSAGAFVQAGIDAEFTKQLGEVEAMEFNFQPSPSADGTTELDQKVQVRFNTAQGIRDFPGMRLATIKDGILTWCAEGARQAPIAEFHEPQPFEYSLLNIARFLVGNAPVARVPQGDHEAVVAIAFNSLPHDTASTISLGLERFSGGIDERLALLNLAQARRLEADSAPGNAKGGATAETITLSDGTSVHLSAKDAPGGQRIVGIRKAHSGVLPEHVLADAHFTAVEHQFYLESRFPDAAVQFDTATATAMLSTSTGSTPVDAHLIATVDSDEFTWAWADPDYASTHSARASFNLQRFGRDNWVPDLVRPCLPMEWAKDAFLPQIAMPILGAWTLLTVPLGEKTGILLASSPTLTLPAPTPEVAEAVLAVDLPAGCDAERARAAYAANRGVASW